jgi:hypothetical protein
MSLTTRVGYKPAYLLGMVLNKRPPVSVAASSSCLQLQFGTTYPTVNNTSPMCQPNDKCDSHECKSSPNYWPTATFFPEELRQGDPQDRGRRFSERASLSPPQSQKQPRQSSDYSQQLIEAQAQSQASSQAHIQMPPFLSRSRSSTVSNPQNTTFGPKAKTKTPTALVPPPLPPRPAQATRGHTLQLVRGRNGAPVQPAPVSPTTGTNRGGFNPHTSQ